MKERKCNLERHLMINFYHLMTNLYFLIFFLPLNVLLITFVYLSESTVLSLDLFKNLDVEIGPQLSTLASEIGEQYLKTIAQYVSFYLLS